MSLYWFVCYAGSVTDSKRFDSRRTFNSHNDNNHDGNNPTDDESYSRANPVDEVIPTDQSVESLIDVDTGVAVVPSNFKEQEVGVSPDPPSHYPNPHR